MSSTTSRSIPLRGQEAGSRPQATTRRSVRAVIAVVGGLLVLGATPLMADDFTVSLLTDVLVLGLLAASLDLLVGYTGLPSLGHSIYYGVGAYASAIVAVDLLPLAPLHLLVGLTAGALLSLLVGLVAVRLRGIYFLMFTLAIAELGRTLALSLRGVTGGSNGVSGIPRLDVLPGVFVLSANAFTFWYVLVVVVVATAGLHLVVRSPFGRALRGIKANEHRMRAIGYNVTAYRLAAFVIAGAVAGVAGSLLVAQTRFVSPSDVGFSVAALALLVIVTGGTGTLYGGFVGALAVVLVRDQLAPDVGVHGVLLLGVLFVVVVYLMPKGVVGTVWPLVSRWWRPRRPAPPAVPPATGAPS